jgi:ABC-type multidrug transport system fused ATPase/permease subunit
LGEWTLSSWAQLGTDEERRSTHYYALILGLTLGFFAAALTADLMLSRLTSTSSASIHRQLLVTLLKQPISFFDNNPVGRILNRFTKGNAVFSRSRGHSMDVFFFFLL